MTRMTTEEMVRELLDNDSTLLDMLVERGIIPVRKNSYEQHHCEDARVAHILLHELDVNIEGVEIIIRMRRELLHTRSQVATLVALRQPNLGK